MPYFGADCGRRAVMAGGIVYAGWDAFEIVNHIYPLFGDLFWAVLLLCALSYNSILKH